MDNTIHLKNAYNDIVLSKFSMSVFTNFRVVNRSKTQKDFLITKNVCHTVFWISLMNHCFSAEQFTDYNVVFQIRGRNFHVKVHPLLC